jgi:prepilin peptidase CpaA
MHSVAKLGLLVWAASIALTDLRARRIPNVLTLPVCLVGILYMLMSGQCATGSPWDSGIWASVFALTVTIPVYAMGKLGAGDAKYLLAIGLLSGWPMTRNTFVIAAALGVLVAMVWWFLRRSPLAQASPSSSAARLLKALTRASGNSPDQLYMPFGTLLSIGFCAELLKR